MESPCKERISSQFITSPVKCLPGTDEVLVDFTEKTWMQDVTFEISGQYLHASRAVLGLYCPVFRAMFGDNFRESQEDIISLPEKEYDDFHEFLQCLYPNICKPVNRSNVYKLLPLAHEYQVSKLLNSCESFIIEELPSLPAREIIECMMLATTFSMNILKEVCAEELIKRDSEELQPLEEQPEFKDIFIYAFRQGIQKERKLRESTETMFAKWNIFPDILVSEQSRFGVGFTMNLQKGFENAVGTYIIIHMDNLCQITTEKSYLSGQVCLWDLAFVAKAETYAATGPAVDSLKVSIECKTKLWEGSKDWSCEMCMKFFLKNQDKTKKNRGCYNSVQISSENLTFEGTDDKFWYLMHPDYGFAGKGDVDLTVFVLANKPVVSG